MKETTKLPSGHELIAQEADFETGVRLYQTIAGELAKQNIELKELSEAAIGGILAKALLVLIGSRAVYDVTWECLKKATLDGMKITKETFEDMDKRADFIPCAKEVIMLNIRPFISGLNLSSLTGLVKSTESQE